VSARWCGEGALKRASLTASIVFIQCLWANDCDDRAAANGSLSRKRAVGGSVFIALLAFVNRS
jgi:hypothetical protein